MIDPNKQYRTREGREVRIYAVDGGGDFPIHGAIHSGCGWTSEDWTRDGKLYLTRETDYDLIEVKPRIKRTVWLVHTERDTVAFRSEDGALDYADSNWPSSIECRKVDCELVGEL